MDAGAATDDDNLPRLSSGGGSSSTSSLSTNVVQAVRGTASTSTSASTSSSISSSSSQSPRASSQERSSISISIEQHGSPLSQNPEKSSRVSCACSNCKKAKARCDNKRPCSRCIRTGRESSCVDCVHQKRGRKQSKRDSPSHRLLSQQEQQKVMQQHQQAQTKAKTQQIIMQQQQQLQPLQQQQQQTQGETRSPAAQRPKRVKTAQSPPLTATTATIVAPTAQQTQQQHLHQITQHTAGTSAIPSVHSHSQAVAASSHPLPLLSQPSPLYPQRSFSAFPRMQLAAEAAVQRLVSSSPSSSPPTSAIPRAYIPTSGQPSQYNPSTPPAPTPTISAQPYLARSSGYTAYQYLPQQQQPPLPSSAFYLSSLSFSHSPNPSTAHYANTPVYPQSTLPYSTHQPLVSYGFPPLPASSMPTRAITQPIAAPGPLISHITPPAVLSQTQASVFSTATTQTQRPSHPQPPS